MRAAYRAARLASSRLVDYLNLMDAIDTDNAVLLLGAALIIAGILSSLIATRFGAPVLLVFLGVGMLAGVDGPLGLRFHDYGLSYLIGSLALAIILFDGGLRTRLTAFRGLFVPSMTLATFGVVITAVLTGVVAHFALALGPAQSFLLGAIVASTDPAAVFFLLRTGGVHLRRRPHAVLELESGTNDPVSVFLVMATVAFLTGRGASDPWQVAVLLAEQAGIGIGGGIIGGFALVALINRTALPAGLHSLLAIASAVAIFALTAVAGGSGFFAAYVAGLVLGNRSVRAYAGIISLNDTVTWLAQIVMFLLLGVLASPHSLPAIALPALGISLFLIFVARPVAVWACLQWFGFDWREKSFVAWVGLRGAVSIFLAVVPILADLPNAALYFDVAFFVVIVSLVLQGWTTPFVARYLRQLVPRQLAPVQRIEIDLPGEEDVELVGYPVSPDARVLNVARMPEWSRTAFILRDHQIVDPALSGRFRPGDYVYLLAPALRAARLDSLFAPLVETANAHASDAEFEIHGATKLSALAAMYDLDLGALGKEQTIAALFDERFDGTPEVGDSLPIANCILSVRAMEGDAVLEAGLRFDEEQRARPSRVRALAQRLLGRGS